MHLMGLTGAIVVDEDEALPAVIGAMKEFVVARDGLFIRAANEWMEALALVTLAHPPLAGLGRVTPGVKIAARIPEHLLLSVLEDARKQMPNEAMYQFIREEPGSIRCVRPRQFASGLSVRFDECAGAVADVHSHGRLGCFFSEQDDADEQGLKIYGVMGNVDTERPALSLRAGVYGNFCPVRIEDVFTGPGPFMDANEGMPEEAG